MVFRFRKTKTKKTQRSVVLDAARSLSILFMIFVYTYFIHTNGGRLYPKNNIGQWTRSHNDRRSWRKLTRAKEKEKEKKNIIPITSDRFVVVGSSGIINLAAATLATLVVSEAVGRDWGFQRDRRKNGPRHSASL